MSRGKQGRRFPFFFFFCGVRSHDEQTGEEGLFAAWDLGSVGLSRSYTTL